MNLGVYHPTHKKKQQSSAFAIYMHVLEEN